MAQKLVRQLPAEGDVTTVSRQFKQADVALALLHSMGQLTWDNPFHYRIQARCNQPVSKPTGIEQMQRYLTTRQCRWRFLLQAFGFAEMPFEQGCGHCDRCRC